jgi:hypothetical protein
MLTSQNKQVPDDLRFVQLGIMELVLAALPLMIPICTIVIRLLLHRIKSRRNAILVDVGCVLSNDDNRYTFIVLSPPSYSGNSGRILLRTTNRSTSSIVCHDRDMTSARSSMRIVGRIGRVELVQEIKGATHIIERNNDVNRSPSLIKAQLLFSLQRPVRYIQRAWRQRRVRRRHLAAMVITSAVLDYLYRPGGPRFGAARDRFVDISSS